MSENVIDENDLLMTIVLSVIRNALVHPFLGDHVFVCACVYQCGANHQTNI